MRTQQEQLVCLGAVFTAALQADRLAHSGHVDDAVLTCLMQSLLVVEPPNSLALYGGQDRELLGGYRLLADLLQGERNIAQDAVRYALSLLMLERKLIKRNDLMLIISERLQLINTKVKHFGILNDNVVGACGELYEDTVSQCGKRIMVHGDPAILQRAGIPEKLRTLLLTGMRAAMQWQQVGGKRWHFFFRRKVILRMVMQRLQRPY